MKDNWVWIVAIVAALLLAFFAVRMLATTRTAKRRTEAGLLRQDAQAAQEAIGERRATAAASAQAAREAQQEAQAAAERARELRRTHEQDVAAVRDAESEVDATLRAADELDPDVPDVPANDVPDVPANDVPDVPANDVPDAVEPESSGDPEEPVQPERSGYWASTPASAAPAAPASQAWDVEVDKPTFRFTTKESQAESAGETEETDTGTSVWRRRRDDD